MCSSDLKEGDSHRYRSVLAEKVELIDPAIETAKEAFLALRKLGSSPNPSSLSSKEKDAFYIAVPNLDLKEIELQNDGWFTYSYKYGRKAGSGNQFVRFVPFDRENIAQATYERFKRALPAAYSRMRKAGVEGAQTR